MEPLITLVAVTTVLFIAGAAGIRRLRPWTVPLRGEAVVPAGQSLARTRNRVL